jgi:hypothetical protein
MSPAEKRSNRQENIKLTYGFKSSRRWLDQKADPLISPDHSHATMFLWKWPGAGISGKPKAAAAVKF